MVENMTTPPEILYRPDRAMQSLRQYIEDNARGVVAEEDRRERYPRQQPKQT